MRGGFYLRKVDRAGNFSYNKDMKQANWAKIICRVLLTVATVAFIVWIFSNSLKVAESSAAQSSSFTTRLQEIFKVIAPTSFIATATGEDFLRLEAVVRTLAHFVEFALLGALCFWTYRVYTANRIWMIAPFAFSALVSAVDEVLQYFTPGRAFEWTDILVDVSGAWAGCLFALGTVALGVYLYKKHKAKKERKVENMDERVGN